jgi:acetate kinase
MSILAVNAGSSSLKFAFYPIEGKTIGSAQMSGNIEGLEPQGHPRITYKAGDAEKVVCELKTSQGEDPFDVALAELGQILKNRFSHLTLQAISHRVVHGGEKYRQSVVVDSQVLEQLQALNSLAPLHQPHNLAGIRAFQKVFSNVPQVACFDTAFHKDMLPQAYTFAIERSWSLKGVRRYGFHGLSYQYVSGVLSQKTKRSSQRVVMAHLGNGASVCAVKNLKSFDTSMGFSALDGLMMGTRSGALDPGVVLFWLEQGLTHDEIQNLLYKKSGLLGVSEVSADMRTLRSSANAQAQFAIDLFTYRVTREIGAQIAVLGGLDVLAFTGGIGEHDMQLRAQVCQSLAYMGIVLDANKNQQANGDQVMLIHADQSSVEVWVVPTDEGRVAAQDALIVCNLKASS